MDPDVPCRVWWDPVHQVAYNRWLPGAVCRLQDAQAVTRATAQLGQGVVPVLVDMRSLSKVERAARQHFSGPESRATAVALVVGSAVSTLIGKVMLGLLDTIPIGTFTDEEKALTWLGAHRRLGADATEDES